jgi:hypothetical protein
MLRGESAIRAPSAPISNSVSLVLAEGAPNLAVQVRATDDGLRLVVLDGTMHHCTTLFAPGPRLSRIDTLDIEADRQPDLFPRL